MLRALTSSIAVLATLALGACSGDDGPAPAPAPAASPSAPVDHTTQLAALFAGNDPEPLDLEQGRCFARALQEGLDEQALVDGGIVDENGDVVDTLPAFDETTATAWVDAQLGCVDYVEASTRALLTQTRGDLDAEAYAACLRAALTDDAVRAALVQTLTGGFDSPEVAALADAQATCAG